MERIRGFSDAKELESRVKRFWKTCRKKVWGFLLPCSVWVSLRESCGASVVAFSKTGQVLGGGRGLKAVQVGVAFL